jgi:DNA-binding winged helix-turn-helix (wHTH) protein
MDQTLYVFGRYRIDPLQRMLWRGDTPVRLTGREFDTLCALASRSGALVEKGVADFLDYLASHRMRTPQSVRKPERL